MAEYKVQLGVKVNTSDIRAQISKYNGNSNNAKLKLGVKLDTKGLSSQIRAINTRTPVTINVRLNTGAVQQQINALRAQIQQLGNIRINLGGNIGGGGGRGAAGQINEVTRAYRELISIQNRINTKQKTIATLDTSKSQREILELSHQVSQLNQRWQELQNRFSTRFSAAQTDNLRISFERLSEDLNLINRRVADVRANLANGIQGNFSGFEAQIASLEQKLGKLSTRSVEVRTGINNVRQALADMRTAATNGDIEGLIRANERYQRALREVEAQLRRNKAVESQANNTAALAQAKQNLSLRMSNWLKDNSAAAKQFGGEIKNLQAQLARCGNTADVNRISAAFKGVTLRAKEAGVATQTLGDKIKAQFSKYTSYFSVYSVFMYSTMALRSMFEQVKAVDEAMTELKKVTNETDASYSQFLTNTASRAKALGTTIDGLVASTADFARLGYGFEESQGLAEVANIYAVVGDEIDSVETATQSLISTLTAFKNEANGLSDTDFALSIVDKMNEVSNNFAISSGGIGEALQRSASSMMAANNSLDETIALITAANTVIQDPDVVGKRLCRH